MSRGISWDEDEPTTGYDAFDRQIQRIEINYVQRIMRLNDAIDTFTANILELLSQEAIKNVSCFPNLRPIYFEHEMYGHDESSALFFNGGRSEDENLRWAIKFAAMMQPLFPEKINLANRKVMNSMSSGHVGDFPYKTVDFWRFVSQNRCSYGSEMDVSIILNKSKSLLTATVLFSCRRNGNFTFNGLKEAEHLLELKKRLELIMGPLGLKGK